MKYKLAVFCNSHDPDLHLRATALQVGCGRPAAGSEIVPFTQGLALFTSCRPHDLLLVFDSCPAIPRSAIAVVQCRDDENRSLIISLGFPASSQMTAVRYKVYMHVANDQYNTQGREKPVNGSEDNAASSDGLNSWDRRPSPSSVALRQVPGLVSVSIIPSLFIAGSEFSTP